MADTGLEVFSTTSSAHSVTVQESWPTEAHNCSVDDGSLRIPLAMGYSLFFLLGLPGNILALWVFLRLHSKKNSVRIFLINLALADLLLIICLPLRVAYHGNHERWTMVPVLCKLVGTSFYMNMYVSIVLLGLISIDRYLKLQKGSRKRRFLSSQQSLFTCCLIWVVAIGVMMPWIVLTKDRTETDKCFHYRQLKKDKWKGYFNLALVLAFWVVYVALITSYKKIANVLFQVSQKKPDFPNAAKYRKTARKSLFILFIFTLCFVPYHTVRLFYILSQILDFSCQWVQVVNTSNEIALLLSALNSCLDPIMYFLLCGSVRKVILQMLPNILCLEASGGLSSSSNELERHNNCQVMPAAQEEQKVSKSILHDDESPCCRKHEPLSNHSTQILNSSDLQS